MSAPISAGTLYTLALKLQATSLQSVASISAIDVVDLGQ